MKHFSTTSIGTAALFFLGSSLAQAEDAPASAVQEQSAQPAEAVAASERPPSEGTDAALTASAPQPQSEAPVASSASAPPSEEPHAANPHGAHPGGGGGASVKDVDEANNPLATKMSANFNDYYAPTLSGVPDAAANTAFLRVSTPFWRILPRVSLPIQSVSSPGSSVSGVGDLQAFATFLFTNPDSPIKVGAGPVYIAPTASDAALGTGKHQAGGALLFVYNTPGLLLGSLVQYQLSFAGDSTRQDTESLTAQVFAIAQIGGGYYLRSAPQATFDVQNNVFNVPIGIGAGKVFMLGKVVTNLFLEPQYVILSQGIGQPVFQIFSGINTQFSL